MGEGERIGNDIIVMACFIYCMWKLTRGGCYSLRERILLAVSVYVCSKFILLKMFGL